MSSVVLVNFGGPRSLEEIPSFLTELLTDGDVIRTSLPRFFEKWFFKRRALKRAEIIAHDYKLIGGKSPIFQDTETIAEELRRILGLPVITFHRYLKETHGETFKKIEESDAEEFIVFPLFPQFSYATTGSIARFFEQNVDEIAVAKMRWVRSYPTHPSYIAAMQTVIRDFLKKQQLEEKDVVLFFSAHGLPQDFVDEGDPYERECHKSFDEIRKGFPKAHSLMAFQSKFGPGEWLRPYTSEMCEIPQTWNLGRRNVVFIPLSFTSDHIETLFEIEYQYLPALRAHGLEALRCPAMNLRQEWLQAVAEIVKEPFYVMNGHLVRN